MKKTLIGGQAVLEGVMMRGERSMATAVRDASGKITVESKYITPIKQKSIWYRVPILRGVLNFVSMMVLGTKTLMRSSEVFGDVTEPSKFENWLSKKMKVDMMQMVMGFAVVLGIALAIGLFFILPQLLTSLFFKIPILASAPNVVKDISEGVIRLVIFVLYVLMCSKVPDVKRVFMYHGAEHKTINAFEHEEELTVQNIQKYTTIHKRCGTTFMFLVMIISIILFSLSSWLFYETLGWPNNIWTRIGIRLVLLPLVAGVSYEVLKLLALSDNIVVRFIRWPGLLLQKLTTKQPDDSMVEVALVAFQTVYNMDRDDTLPELNFEIKKSMAEAKKTLIDILPENEFESSDIDWILCNVLNVNRGELKSINYVNAVDIERAVVIANERAKHIPLQYILGSANFYGFDIDVTAGVLIPRPETELLCEQVIKIAEGKKVLDLCTGSGAIAIAVSKSVECEMVATDISSVALDIAKRNAEKLNAKVIFFQGDLFENIDGKFDIIVSNPPYIKSSDILNLAVEVKDYEPLIALDGGLDGYCVYTRIIDEVKSHLNEGGTLMLEVGEGQADEIKAMLFDKFEDITILNDYNNIPRIIIAK
ncbi:MAG: peptide chain release factor N(5)-glutamine methyltransferase [Clostridia bacterium]